MEDDPQQVDDIFGKAGVNDLEVGTALFNTLGLTFVDMSIPGRAEKIKEIAEFLNLHTDPHYVIGLTKYNKSSDLDNLDYLLGYTRLSKQKMELMDKVNKIDEELKFYAG